MFRPTRFLAALGAVFFAGVGLAACGGGIPSDAVVQVDGKADHQDDLQPLDRGGFGRQRHDDFPARKRAKPVCPNRLRTRLASRISKQLEPKPAKGQKPKTEAAAQDAVRTAVQSAPAATLGFLISSDWVIGEAEEHGRASSPTRKSSKHFNELKKQQFPKEAEFQKFLATTGQSDLGLAAAREAQHALDEDPGKGHQGATRT